MSELEAGREMDKLIATKVLHLCIHKVEKVPIDVLVKERRQEFLDEYGVEAPDGWDGGANSEYSWDDHYPTRCSICLKEVGYRSSGAVAQYSNDLGRAWELVNKFNLSVCKMHDGRWIACDLRDGWFNFQEGNEEIMLAVDTNIGVHGIADTPALAICRAALEMINE